MTKYFLFILPFILNSLFACKSGKINTMKHQNPYNFESAWHKVDSLERKGLFKSAMVIVNEVYEEAVKSSFGDQKIKALMYTGKYSNFLKENNLESFEKLLRKEIAKSDFPDKQILQSILAEFYDKYLNINIQKIRKRTEINDIVGNDIQTWTAGKFIMESNKLFNASISNPKLKNISYEKYKTIFTEAKNTEKMRDNLYEILAYRALNHFKNDRNYLPQTTQSFQINNSDYFSIPAVFTKLELKSNNKYDSKYKTLTLFQELEKYNLETKDYEELLDITMKRIDFVKSQYLRQDKDKLYLNTLNNLISKYPGYKTTAELYYKKASIFKSMGEKVYSSKNINLKWKIKEARDICIKVEKEYKNSLGRILCMQLRDNIERTYLKINTEKINIPNENILDNIEYKNIKKAYFKIIKITHEQFEKFKKESNKKNKVLDKIKKLSPIQTWEVKLPDDGDYRDHSVETDITPLNKGVYILMVSNNDKFSSKNGIVAFQYMHISNLSYWTRYDNEEKYIFVVDRKTGNPVKNATVDLSYWEWNQEYRNQIKTQFLKQNTNAQGYIKFDTKNINGPLTIKVSKENDILDIDENVFTNNNSSKPQNKSNIIFFTDRPIYRPGQTVYFKGLYIQINKENIPSIIPNKHNIKILFTDTNWQKINEITVSTNEYGSFKGSFTIPQSGLTGNMHILEKGTLNFTKIKIEEYKRPKFEVSFKNYSQNYKLGDKINLTGIATSFSGFPIQNAKVVYTVKRNIVYPYNNNYHFNKDFTYLNPIEILHGETITGKNGEFNVPLELFVDDIDLEEGLPNFYFVVKADVTDMTGETHSASKILKAGITEVNISFNTPKTIKEDKEVEIEIKATNNNDQKISAEGKVYIYKLIAPQKIFRDRFWEDPDTFIYSREEFYEKFPFYAYKNDNKKQSWKEDKILKTISFNTYQKEKYKLKLAAGEYKIVLKFDDPSGKKLKLDKFVSVYSNNINPANTLLLTETDKEKYHPTTDAKIKWLSAVSGLNVYISMGKIGNEQFNKQWLNVNKNSDISIKILEEFKGDVLIQNTYVYNNRFYQDIKRISVPWYDKHLKFEYLSFRSKLYPGQNEEWSIKISGEKADKIVGEVLASMYDASLDKIYKKVWQTIQYPYAEENISTSYGFDKSQTTIVGHFEYPEYDDSKYHKQYRHLNWFRFNLRPFYGHEIMKSRMAAYLIDEPELEAPMKIGNTPDIDISDINNDIFSTNKENQETKNQEIQIRTNLNETVFFYPNIITDKDGNFILKFKMNDALTKWKLRLFAHTKDLKFGYDEKQIITEKELMIIPNNPRFIREGDNLTFKIRIDNLTEKKLKGECWVELYDAETMKNLEKSVLKSTKNTKFKIDEKGSTLISWNMEFPENVSNLLIYRFYANAGNYSDAEEGILPVLTNRKLVTETLPLWVKGNETKEFVFKSLKNSKNKDLKNISFTIEATSHPIWLAIQTLPYLKNVNIKNSISYANALFSNLLARKILNDNPKIQKVFDKWNNIKNKVDNEALWSNLSKNQELKNILLEDTPWVLDAKNEEQQKRNISLLFNLNQIQNEKSGFINKLESFQNADGGFSWFQSGKSNRYITQNIIETFGKMKQLGVLKNEVKINNIIKKAFKFVNNDVVIQYKKLLELAKKGKIDLDKNHLESLMIHYMYTLQFYPEIQKNKDLQDAYNYYFTQAKKYWTNRPLYIKGMLALVLNMGGEPQIAKEILKAAEEQSITNEELGMYWKSYHGYHWWQLPIETQALMIESFDKVNHDTRVVDQLKVWLLKNKQTNKWKTGKATVSAIYALLFDNGGTIGESDIVKIFVAGHDVTNELSKNDIQAGTGYYKKNWPGIDVNSGLSAIKIKNTNKDIAWGAAYWQYLQDLDKIENFEDTPLKIKRTLYLVYDTDNGKEMKEVKEYDILQPGDLVKVQIRLQVDREMEFVHLSDQHAATFEPLQQLSGYHWQGGLGYYQNPRDTKMNFFIGFLPRGVFVLEYPLRVTQSGTFSNGIAELQSFYAPEFSSHSNGLIIKVK